MNIKVLYAVGYFDRTLFSLEIDGEVTRVYRGSGLNGGRVGKILPYSMLMSRIPRLSEAMEGTIPGYIFKEFFYDGGYIFHGKNMSQYMLDEFCDYLEEQLKDYTKEDGYYTEDYNTEEEWENILFISKKINKEMDEVEKGKQIFDWLKSFKNLSFL